MEDFLKKIKITFENVSIQAELNNSETAQNIYDRLPFESLVNTWGDEIYFEIPVIVAQSTDAIEEVDIGSLGYWAVGRAFCIFFGPTPVSSGDMPRAASPVNVFGNIIGDLNHLRDVKSGAVVKVEHAG